MPQLEFFYDCSSPWTYLAFERVEELTSQTESTLVWRPILVGGVFNSINPSVYEQRAHPVPSKARYYAKDLQDWAGFYGLKINWPSVFPVNSVKAMRACLVLEPRHCLPAWSRAVFEAYWRDGLDISQDSVIEEVANRIGVDPALVLSGIAEPAIKEKLKANTQEMIDRGGFGSPTFFVNRDDMYFGNDRLPLVREALLRYPRWQP